jgi:DNA-binding NtrC family response regulator
MSFKVLILDDEERITSELSEYLLRKGFQVKSASRPSEAFRILEKNSFDIQILDIRLSGNGWSTGFETGKGAYPEMEVLLISGHGDMDTVIEALRSEPVII